MRLVFIIVLATIVLTGCNKNPANVNSNGNANANANIAQNFKPPEALKPVDAPNPDYKPCNLYFPLVPVTSR